MTKFLGEPLLFGRSQSKVKARGCLIIQSQQCLVIPRLVLLLSGELSGLLVKGFFDRLCQILGHIL